MAKQSRVKPLRFRARGDTCSRCAAVQTCSCPRASVGVHYHSSQSFQGNDGRPCKRRFIEVATESSNVAKRPQRLAPRNPCFSRADESVARSTVARRRRLALRSEVRWHQGARNQERRKG